jgi:hypothetical protein
MKRIILSLFLILISILCFIVIDTYPAGDDWITASIIETYIAPFIILMHLALSLTYYIGKKRNWLLITQASLSLLTISQVVWYIYSHKPVV